MEKSVRHCSHCQSASSFSSRNRTESKDLATQPQRYFCLFGCESQLLYVIRPSFSEPAQPALLTPSLWKDRCGAAAGGKQGSGAHLSGFSVSLSLSAASLSRRAGVLDLSVLEPFLVLLLLLSRSGAPRFPWGCRPWR